MLAVAALLIYGVRESARTNTVMVVIKLAILVFFIVVGVGSINGDNFSPWAPHGFSGTVDAAALIFFAYIGFDAISTSGEEAENPSRDLPIAIIGSLLICDAALHPRRGRRGRAGAGEQARGLRRAAGRRAEDGRRASAAGRPTSSRSAR